jgi:hypothetical protein
LLQDPLPAEGIFLPLTDTDFRSCLPLTSACSDDGTGLVLVPARTSEIAWHPIDASELPGDNSDLRGLESIPAVGVGPAAPREQNYALTMLDLSTSVIGLRTLVRSVDAKGELTVALGSAPLFGAVAAGPDTTVQGGATPTPNPFGRPTIVRGSTLSEAAPVIPMYAAPTPQVLHALRADVTWGVNVEVIPLVGASLPFLARAVDGTPGLYVARPPGLRLAVAGAATTAPASDDDDDDGGGGGGGGPATPLVLLGSVAVLVAGALGVALLRRRRTGDDEDDLDVGSAQDGARLAAAAAAAVDDVAPAPIAAVAAVQPDDDDVEDEDDLDGGRALAAADADADVDAADDDDAAYDEIQQSAQDELAALVAAASAAAGNTDDMYDDDGVVTYDVEIDDEPHDTGRPTDPVRYVELTADPAFNRGSTVERDDILPGFEDDDED